jgi:uncharacterized protein (DUF1778 family)
MADRTVLLISCSKEEAEKIRQRAASDRRTISGYVLNICLRAVSIQEKISERTGRRRGMNAGTWSREIRQAPRTTMLLRCSTEESQRIRAAAEMEDRTISGFILHCLRRSWMVAEALPKAAPQFAPRND